jgi:hypothetical protein
MTNIEFVEKLKNIADNMKTLYVMGGFGAPAGYGNNKNRYANNCSYNKQTARTSMIKNCSDDTFFFDCICLGKGILWGFSGDTSKVYGGAAYKSNDVPDFGADSLISHCVSSSSDFSNIEIGEWLWMKGHAGYYVGDGMVIESTPAWKNCVQYTKLADRKWLKHGKIKYLEYVKEECHKCCPYWIDGKCTKYADTEPPKETVKTNDEIAREVINGLWGNGNERKEKLTAAGYDYSAIQAKVNEIYRKD